MRPLEFIFNIVDKFTPMQENERVELRRDAMTDYLTATENVSKGEQPKNLKEKVMVWIAKNGESWIVRLILSLLFIWICPQIQNYVSGNGVDDDFEEGVPEGFEIVD